MPNQWNKGDVLKLIADCELGKYGDVLHVTSVAGPYMTATVQRRGAPDPVVHTGRDYAYAVKVGTFEPDGTPAPTVADVVRRLHENSERAPDVRAVPMRLVHQADFDELLRVAGVAP